VQALRVGGQSRPPLQFEKQNSPINRNFGIHLLGREDQ